jgi:hypothetical protein
MTQDKKKFNVEYSFPDGTKESVPYTKVLESLFREAQILKDRGDPSMMEKLLEDLAASKGSRIMESGNKAAAKIDNGKAPSKEVLLAEIASITGDTQDRDLIIKAKHKLAKKYDVRYNTIHKKIS